MKLLLIINARPNYVKPAAVYDISNRLFTHITRDANQILLSCELVFLKPSVTITEVCEYWIDYGNKMHSLISPHFFIARIVCTIYSSFLLE